MCASSADIGSRLPASRSITFAAKAMIRISVVRDRRGDIVGWSVSGHSGFAPRGEDIVCAGVSAIVQTTLLGLQNAGECAAATEMGS